MGVMPSTRDLDEQERPAPDEARGARRRRIGNGSLLAGARGPRRRLGTVELRSPRVPVPARAPPHRGVRPAARSSARSCGWPTSSSRTSPTRPTTPGSGRSCPRRPLAEQEHREAQTPRRRDGAGTAPTSLAEIDRARADPGRAARPPDRRATGPLTATSEPTGEPALPTRVVIAEDEAIIRLDLKETLEEEGYEVVGETGRGDEAVELVRELEPDLAILDIKMPGLDGLVGRPRDRRRAPGRGADPHRLQPARPDRAGPRRRRAGLPGQAVPEERPDPRRRGGARPLPGDAGPRTTRPRASRSSSRPARSSTGPRAG